MFDPAKLDALARLVARLCDPDPLPERPAGDVPGALVRAHFLAPLASRVGFSEFRNDFIANSLLAQVRERILAEGVAALSARAIPVILLKGISYAGYLYADPAERPMSDIDLLVPPAAHGDAVRVLRRQGYWAAGSSRQASPMHHAISLKRKGAAIDLHRSIMQPLRSRIDIHAIWRRARPAPERADGALRLDPIDEAVLHLAHAARHELGVPLINYVDAHRLLTRVPHDQVIDRARRYRLGRGVRAAVTMTRALCSRQPDPTAAWHLLPSCRELLARQPVSRPVQLMRKALLLDGPVQLLGLILAYAHARMIPHLRP
jgi:hypothetical protein